MGRARSRIPWFLTVGVLSVAGCATHSETAGRDALTTNVGVYPPPPSGIERPRVAVPPFLVTAQPHFFAPTTDPNSLAADQMTTLLSLSDRFAVVERAQLEQLLKEQDLEGIVKPGELARPGLVRGVDYLLVGKVTNLRVKLEKSGTTVGTGGFLSGILPVSDVGVAKSDVMVSSDCGVDIRLVDPTSGEVAAANFGEFKRVDSAQAIGLGVGRFQAESSADVEISEDDKGKILRLALDDALRKTIPKIDAVLAARGVAATSKVAVPPSGSAANGVAPNGAGTTGGGAAPTAVAGGFCSQCGQKRTPGAKFCAGCGAKVE